MSRMTLTVPRPRYRARLCASLCLRHGLAIRHAQGLDNRRVLKYAIWSWREPGSLCERAVACAMDRARSTREGERKRRVPRSP
jgi:hypothetical protein